MEAVDTSDTCTAIWRRRHNLDTTSHHVYLVQTRTCVLAWQRRPAIRKPGLLSCSFICRSAVDLSAFLTMVKKGLSLEQKREVILSIFHENDDVFQLKDIEKKATARGVVSQSVKCALFLIHPSAPHTALVQAVGWDRVGAALDQIEHEQPPDEGHATSSMEGSS